MVLSQQTFGAAQHLRLVPFDVYLDEHWLGSRKDIVESPGLYRNLTRLVQACLVDVGEACVHSRDGHPRITGCGGRSEVVQVDVFQSELLHVVGEIAEGLRNWLQSMY